MVDVPRTYSSSSSCLVRGQTEDGFLPCLVLSRRSRGRQSGYVKLGYCHAGPETRRHALGAGDQVPDAEFLYSYRARAACEEAQRTIQRTFLVMPRWRKEHVSWCEWAKINATHMV